jgi:hypothetical protein
MNTELIMIRFVLTITLADVIMMFVCQSINFVPTLTKHIRS